MKCILEGWKLDNTEGKGKQKTEKSVHTFHFVYPRPTLLSPFSLFSSASSPTIPKGSHALDPSSCHPDACPSSPALILHIRREGARAAKSAGSSAKMLIHLWGMKLTFRFSSAVGRRPPRRQERPRRGRRMPVGDGT
ncbi:hypothetical protein SISSUDRAFT_450914 [Sistotremastrum suecicum HHB10207 ss-3]|uniref:Uncharacterized protein n=1 Tax=Sistotremastrum suecicum HHB10207 ss-3 TaxID=1314776 RepID=A0A166FIG1_9AGAM|nr:hypothetical protein SISSUDRAFT_551672 [Sistotremastrum suecicum HHB10207 ss-3]KZT40676.1 hypothetical protein SISSUDRAFT_450914 [Sistotremastrum suecicum HHB10207 ss-3]